MLKIFDLHNDYFLKFKSDKKRDNYVNKKIKPAESVVSAVWTSELDVFESIREIERARDYLNRFKNLFLGVEDLHFLGDDNIDKFLMLKPIYAGLTWNLTNCLAGGCNESGRLTNFGKLAIKKLENNNIFVDSAHLNEESFMDLSKISNKPLLCSHTGFFGVNEHKRNLKDYQIKMIIDSGGLVGLCLVSEFLSGEKHCEIGDIVCHIDYFACKFGIDNLALGTDFYGTKSLPKGIKNYSDLSQKLCFKLKNLGYTEKSINKIFFDNANKYFFEYA